MSNEEIEALLKKYLEDELSSEDRIKVEQWLESEIDKQRVLFTTWGSTRKEQLLARIHQKIKPKEKARIMPLKRWLQIAATLLVLTSVSYYTWEKGKPTTVVYATASASLQKQILDDGSIVWLKPHSTLSYPEHFTGNERHVQLQGEALFEVAKDSAHPFVIQCGELTATVLGTSFNVKMGKGDIEVAVLTGKVSLTTAHENRGIVVLPNEKAVYQIDQSRIVKMATQEGELSNAIARTEYNMQFQEMSFSEIVQRIEGKFNVTVRLESTNLNTCTITADLTDQPLQTTLQSMADVFDFEYSIENNSVTIRGGSCQ